MAATLIGAIGAATLVRVHTRRELPLAAMPVFFAIQQSIEGFLWLTLPVAPLPPVTTDLTEAFLMFALVFWPVYVPIAVLGVESDARRRLGIGACAIAGMIVAAYFLFSLHQAPRTGVISAGHIVYSGDPRLPAINLLLYPLATCLGPLLSSLRPVRLLGALVTTGSVVAYIGYWKSFSSVWCFFAAAASAVILFQFEQARRRRALAYVTP